ncbi:hypothetical protein F4780DRAFT_776481 [Xylariomycetidae sp. FL0641]|nr:hypothetical protein F4780DRAFT_776481 [Xylariomycetidae sp. FL0641]
MYFFLIDRQAEHVPDQWYDSHWEFYKSSNELQGYRVIFKEELRVLRAYRDGVLTVDQAAYQITRPITTTPILERGSRSLRAKPLRQLWELLICASIEWPPVFMDSTVDLLVAIRNIPDAVHCGEMIKPDPDDGTTQSGVAVSWNHMPHFAGKWVHASRHLSLHRILRRAKKDGKFDPAMMYESQLRNDFQPYISMHEAQARLVHHGFLPWGLALKHVTHALERKHCLRGDWAWYIYLIPTAKIWVTWNGVGLLLDMAQEEYKSWEANSKVGKPMSKPGPQRWLR